MQVDSALAIWRQHSVRRIDAHSRFAERADVAAILEMVPRPDPSGPL